MKKRICLMIIVFGILLSGCISLPLIPSPAKNKPQLIYGWKEERKTTPNFALGHDNKPIVFSTEEQSVEVSYEKTIPTKSLAQKIGGWISGLGTLALVGIIIGLVLFPGATITILIKQVFKWKSALKQTSRAIKEVRLQEKSERLEETLKTYQSDKTKKLIGQIKADI